MSRLDKEKKKKETMKFLKSIHKAITIYTCEGFSHYQLGLRKLGFLYCKSVGQTESCRQGLRIS